LPKELKRFVKTYYAQNKTIKKSLKKIQYFFLNKLNRLLQTEKEMKKKLPAKYYKYIKIFFLQNAKNLLLYRTYNYKMELKLNAKVLYLRNKLFLLTELKIIKK